MKDQIIDALKRLARPITSQKFRIEKLRYGSRPIVSAQSGNDLIRETLESGRPAAIGKLGGTELRVVRRYIKRRPAEGDTVQSWAGVDAMVHNLSGLYPKTPEVVSRFARLYIETTKQVDLLAAWYMPGEAAYVNEYLPDTRLFELRSLEPYFHASPWSKALAGKRVVVVTPFEQSTRSQFERRGEVWKAKPEVLPDCELSVLRVPLYPQMVDAEYPTWFEAFDYFRGRLDAVQFDILIAGAGAWSLPLCVHAKSLGKCGIHTGGATQILFGIRGRRWDDRDDFKLLFNDAWIRPSAAETPKKTSTVENACYW
jgi:hypothetical protein